MSEWISHEHYVGNATHTVVRFGPGRFQAYRRRTKTRDFVPLGVFKTERAAKDCCEADAQATGGAR